MSLMITADTIRKILSDNINKEYSFSREEAIAIMNLPEEDMPFLMEMAGSLRKKYKGNHVSIHLLTNARSGNCSQNCAYCAQSCRSKADIENTNGLMMKSYTAIMLLYMIIIFQDIASVLVE